MLFNCHRQAHPLLGEAILDDFAVHNSEVIFVHLVEPLGICVVFDSEPAVSEILGLVPLPGNERTGRRFKVQHTVS
jgi:hypothetical protein